jgi:hypothetical protein
MLQAGERMGVVRSDEQRKWKKRRKWERENLTRRVRWQR